VTIDWPLQPLARTPDPCCYRPLRRYGRATCACTQPGL